MSSAYVNCCATRSFLSLRDIALLQAIAAKPRPTGKAAIAKARERCALELRSLGYDVHERPFVFSAFPGQLATPLMGGATAIVIGLAGRWGAEGRRFAPLILLAMGSVALLVAGMWLAKRGVLEAPVLRQRGMNMEATRPDDGPTTVWLAAHLDSKWQRVPTLVRTVGMLLVFLGYLLTLGLAVASAAGGHAPLFPWAIAAVVTLGGAFPVVLSTVGTGSPGALDNASGVVTVIAAARQLGGVRGVGVLITDAEELGLAGARAWSRDAKTATMLNVDGVDDTGGIQVMFTGRRPTQLLAVVDRATRVTGIPHQAGRLIPGILTDSVAFSDAGLPSVTFARGSLRSLLRVHTSRDDLAHLRGTGIAETATLMAATVREIGETH
jgi:hypothetical protein